MIRKRDHTNYDFTVKPTSNSISRVDLNLLESQRRIQQFHFWKLLFSFCPSHLHFGPFYFIHSSTLFSKDSSSQDFSAVISVVKAGRRVQFDSTDRNTESFLSIVDSLLF